MPGSASPVTLKQQLRIVGILYFSKPDSPYPGWFCQVRNASGQLEDRRLWTVDADDAAGARKEAADHLGCMPEQIRLRRD